MKKSALQFFQAVSCMINRQDIFVNVLPAFLPFRNDFPIDQFLCVVKLGNRHDHLIADVKVLVILVRRICTQAIQIFLQLAEHAAFVFSRNNGRPPAAKRVTGIGAVKRVMFRLLNGYPKLRLFRIVFLDNRRIGLAGTVLFPQIRNHGIGEIPLGERDIKAACTAQKMGSSHGKDFCRNLSAGFRRQTKKGSATDMQCHAPRRRTAVSPAVNAGDHIINHRTCHRTKNMRRSFGCFIIPDFLFRYEYLNPVSYNDKTVDFFLFHLAGILVFQGNRRCIHTDDFLPFIFRITIG